MNKFNNSKKNIKKSKSSNGILEGMTFLILIALGSYFVFVPKQKINVSQFSSLEKVNLQSKDINNKKVDKIDLDSYLDKELKVVDRNGDLNSKKVMLDNRKYVSNDLVPRPKGVSKSQFGFVRDQLEDHSSEVYLDTIQSDPQRLGAYDPAARLEEIIAKKQMIRQYDRNLREAYVRQLIANAEKDGVKLLINQDLEIVGVQQSRAEIGLKIPAGYNKPYQQAIDPFDPYTNSIK